MGSAVGAIEEELKRRELPYSRGETVPLDQLANLLVTPDAHLITLSDAFVGFVLPSKVHACNRIAPAYTLISAAHVLTSTHSVRRRLTAPYFRVEVEDAKGCWRALEELARLRAENDFSERVTQESASNMSSVAKRSTK